MALSRSQWDDEDDYYFSKIQDFKFADKVYVLDWATYHNEIFAFGIDECGNSAKIKVRDTETSLYVFADNFDNLSVLLNLKCVDLKRCITRVDIDFEIPDNSLLDTLVKKKDTARQWHTYKIPTTSFKDSMQLHRILNSTASKNFIKTTATWSLELLLVFEMAVKGNCGLDKCVVYDTFVDCDLNRYENIKRPIIRVVGFDIETLSSYDNRLPLGDAKNDIIFSVSLVDRQEKKLYTLLNIPVPLNAQNTNHNNNQNINQNINQTCNQNVGINEDIKIKRKRADTSTSSDNKTSKRLKLPGGGSCSLNGSSLDKGFSGDCNKLDYVEGYNRRVAALCDKKYDEIAHLERSLVVFNDEEDLLKALFQLLDTKNVYYLLGYNSKGYDMMFLMRRAAYLCMPEFKNFYLYRGMPVYGRHMIHIDLIKIFRQLYQDMGKLTLDAMAKNCLGENDGKVKFNAVDIRHIYRHMLNRGLPENGFFEKYNIDLATIAHYNDIDTLLLIRLWDTLSYDEFIPELCKSHLISIIRYTQCKIGEYINNKSIYSSLVDGRVLYSHKSIASTGNVLVNNGSIMYTYNQITVSAGVNEKSYGGGFNMRFAREVYKNCKVNDVVAYYPKLKQGHNISYETVAVVHVDVLRKLEPYIDRSHKCRYFSFTVHKNSTDELVNATHTRNLITLLENNCDELESLEECCTRLRPDDRVLILSVEKKPSLLGLMIYKQNALRDRAKDFKKRLEEMLAQVEIRQVKLGEVGDDDDDGELEFDTDDEDDEEDEVENEVNDNADSANQNDENVNVNDVDAADNDVFRNVDVDGNSDMKMLEPRFKLLSFEEISKFSDLEELERYKVKLRGELSRVNSLYRNLKLVNCSYYGLLGSDYGALSGRVVAATLTTLGRKYIIEMARHALTKNFEAVLIDTDSVFIHNGDGNLENNPLPEYAKHLNHELELTSKMYQFIFIMAKKVYLAKCNGTWISRGINKNGPEIWNTIIFNLAEKYLVNKTDIGSSQLREILEREVYMFIAEKAKADRSILLCTMCPNMEKTDTANTPIAKMIRGVQEEEPDYIFSGRRVPYFHLLRNEPTEPVFGAGHRIESVSFGQFNLFKFISKINTTIYQILSKAIGDTNIRKYKLYASITQGEYNTESLAAFMNVNEKMREW